MSMYSRFLAPGTFFARRGKTQNPRDCVEVRPVAIEAAADYTLVKLRLSGLFQENYQGLRIPCSEMLFVL